MNFLHSFDLSSDLKYFFKYLVWKQNSGGNLFLINLIWGHNMDKQ